MCLLARRPLAGHDRAAAPPDRSRTPVRLQLGNTVREPLPAAPVVVAAVAPRHPLRRRASRDPPQALRRCGGCATRRWSGVAVTGVVAANGPVVVDAADYAWNEYERHQGDYRAEYGFWETVELPEEFRLSAVHAALLHTGKVLLIAGSGNNAERFEAGTFRSILWDPVSGETKEIPTPEDLFCAGHAYLPDGNLLIAGGTREYEQLEDQVDRAAGVLSLTNDHDEAADAARGQRVHRERAAPTSPPRRSRCPRRTTMPDGTAMGGVADVWVEARGPRGRVRRLESTAASACADLPAAHRGKVFARANSVTKEKQNFQGLDASYEFDVATETYRRTGRLDEPRWYPTLHRSQRRPGPGRLRPRRVRPGPARRQRDLRPGHAHLDRPAAALPVLPDLSGAVPAGRRRADLLQRLQHRLRPGGPGAAARHLGPDRQQLGGRARPRGPRVQRDQRVVLPRPRAGPARGHRRRRSGRRQRRVDRALQRGRPQRRRPAVRAGAGLPEPGAVHQRRHAARRHHPAHRRFGGLPRATRRATST